VIRALVAGVAVLALGPGVALGGDASQAKKKKPAAAKCPAGTTPVIAKQGRKAVLKRDKRGRVKCAAVKRSGLRAPAPSPTLQVGQVADTLGLAADINPKAFAKLNRAIGGRRADRLLNLGLVAWRQTAGAAHAAENETKSFGYGGADGNVTFGLEKVEGEQSGFRANASAEMKVARADLEKLSSDLKDKLPPDVTGARAKVDVGFEDVAATCPTDKGAVPGRLHGKGSITVTVERSDGAPIEVTLGADVETSYTAQVGADGKIEKINGVDVKTTFQTGGSGTSTETYRGHIAGSGFGREALLDAPKGTFDAALQRDWSHVDLKSGGVFGPHGSWRYGGPFPISDLRTVDNIKAMAATSVATQLLTLAALEYVRKVSLDRIDKSPCGYSVLFDITSEFRAATHQASGKLSVTVPVRAVPGSPGRWTGSASLPFQNVQFIPHTECPYIDIVSNPGTITVDIKLLPNGNIEVTWSGDHTSSASIDCPPDNSDPPNDPPPIAGQQGPSLVGVSPTTFELPASGGLQNIGGGVDGGGGDGFFDSGTLLVSRS
jgi:hypothetical protein